MGKNRTRGHLKEEIFVRRPTSVEVLVSVRQSLWNVMLDTGHQVLDALLEEDRERLCGAEKGKHHAEREAYRHGFDEGSVVLGGRSSSSFTPPFLLFMNFMSSLFLVRFRVLPALFCQYYVSTA